tara:strand:- start:7427 stop:7672 length:246 start_codon:yes stop_codon:yes gene_type:complete
VALSDEDKELMRIPLVTASFLDTLAKTTDVDTFHMASEALQMVPVEQIAEALAALRTDEVFIVAGSFEIDDVEVEIFDDEE